jgi:hypothetical protein
MRKHGQTVLNNVNINYDKTKIMVFHKSRDTSVKNEIFSHVLINNVKVERVYVFKYLGLIFDTSMTFSKHFSHVQSKVSQRLNYLHGIKRYLSPLVTRIMVNSYVHSVIDFGLDIYAVQTKVQLAQLQGTINRFLTGYFLPSLIRRSKYSYDRVKAEVDINKILKDCNFLTVAERADYVLLKNMFKSYQTEKLAFTTHSVSKNMPHVQIASQKSNCVSYRGAQLWNNLPPKWILKDLTYNKFKENVHTWIVEKRDDIFVYS